MEQASIELGLSGTLHFKMAQAFDQPLLVALQHFYAAVAAEETVLEQQSRFTVSLRLLLEHHAERTPRARDAAKERLAIERANLYIHDRFAAMRIPTAILGRL